MSHFNPNQHFDVENWRDQQIALAHQRTRWRRDAAFAEKKYAGDALAGVGPVSDPVLPVPCATAQHPARWTAARLSNNNASEAGTPCGRCLPPARMMKLNSGSLPQERRYREPLFWRSKEKKRQKQIEKKEPAAEPTGPRKGREAPRKTGSSRG